MAMNRKAVFFSLTSLVVVAMLFVLFAPEDARTVDDAAYERIQDLSQDRAQLEDQVLPIILRSYARTSLNDLARTTIQDGGSHLTGTNALENQLSTCLGAGEEDKDLIPCGNRDSQEHLLRAIERVEDKYQTVLQHDVAIRLNSIDSITQISPWELALTANFSIAMNDTAGIARYERTRVVRTTLNINGLIDPLGSSVRGQEHRFSRDTSNNWTQENLTRHAIHGTYAFNERAPSYLDRLRNQTTASPVGIHSLIEGTDRERNAVDFDTTSYADVCLFTIRLGGGNRIQLNEYYVEYYGQFDATEEASSDYDPEAC